MEVQKRSDIVVVSNSEKFSVEDYIAENVTDENINNILSAAHILGNSGLVEVAEKLHIGVARYKRQQNK